MDKEILDSLMSAMENYHSAVAKLKTDVKDTKASVSEVSKSIPTKVKDVVAKEVAKIPQPDNADYALLKRLMEEDIAKYLDKHNMTVDGLKSGLQTYIDSMKADITGPEGKEGKPGRDGKDGRPGKDGLTGPKGPKGEKGVDGKTGKAGRDGKDGTSSNIEDIIFKDGVLCFKVDGKKKEITLPIPQGYGGSGSGRVAAKMSELRDVLADRPDKGQYLAWNGNKWVATNAPGVNSVQNLAVDGTADVEAYVTLVNANVNVTIPSAFDNVGVALNIKSVDVDGCTISSADGIDASNEIGIVQYENLKIVSNGTQWYVV